jgi:uncharacterized protein (DUF1800 family)
LFHFLFNLNQLFKPFTFMASLDPVSSPMGVKMAAHLLRRTTFGPTKQEVDQFASLSPSQALAILFQPVTKPSPPLDPATSANWVSPKPDYNVNSDEDFLRTCFSGWTLDLMMNAGTKATEKLTFFLHTNFTTIASVVDKSTALYYQNQLLRYYALGNIKELAVKICYDNAMLVLLDGRLNEAQNPNENFAREFLELFTIGKGPELGPGDYTNYTETDIQQAARVLSGYQVDTDFSTMDTLTGVATGILKTNASNLANKHDAGTKTFSAAFQNRVVQPNPLPAAGSFVTPAVALDEINQLVNMIFDQQATALTICRKLYRFFVYYLIPSDVEANVIVPLANTLVANNYELKPVLEQLLQSQHFFDQDNGVQTDDNRGAIIKSPIELVVGTLRFFNVVMPAQTDLSQFYDVSYRGLLDYMDDMGMVLYEPLDVAGYDAYHQEPGYNRNWISANFLARRYQFIDRAIKGTDKGGGPLGFNIDIMTWVNNTQNIADPTDSATIVQALVDYLLPEVISQDRFDYFHNDLLLDNLTPFNWYQEWNNYTSSGDDAAVRMQLENLLNGLLQSPEYQLY